jgi:tripartite ATP-independent transporter DctP family solute receptor
MKKNFATAFIAAAASLLAVTAYAQTIELKMAHGSPRGHPNYVQADQFARDIERVTNGRVKVTVYGDRQLGDDRDIIQIVRTGTADLGYASSVNFPLILKKVSFDALQLPGLVKSYDDLGKTLVGPAAIKMLDSLQSDGLVGLAFSDGGQRNFLSRLGFVPKIDDMKGLKTRIVPIPLHKEIWQMLGTNPVGIPYGEVYTAMQTHVIDAVEFNISSIAADKVYEQANYVTMTGHYFWPGLFFANKAKFETLPKDIQAAIIKVARESTPKWIAGTKADEEKKIGELKAKGVKFANFEDRAKLLKMMQPLFDEWSAKDPLIGEYIQDARRIDKGS